MSPAARPMIIAHRGHSLGAPENTEAAFRAAVLLGAEMIEADVRVTADGTLVVLHDPNVDRTTDGTGPVEQYTDERLDTLDAGGWFAPEFAGQRVPTLDWLFDFAARESVALCLEVKGETRDEQRQLALRIARAILARGRLEQDVLASFDHGALAGAAEAVPGLRVAPDRLPERGPSDADTLLAQARACGASIIQHHCDDLTADVVAQVQGNGVDVWAWPATTDDQVRRMASFGVVGIMGDDIAAIARVVADR